MLLATASSGFFSVEGLVRYRFDTMQSIMRCVGLCILLSSPAVNSVYFLKKYSGSTHSHCGAMSYPSYPYSKEKSRPTELPSRGLPFVENIGRERGGSGEGREDPSPEGPSPDIILFNAKFVLPQLVEDGAHGDRHHTGKERDPLFR